MRWSSSQKRIPLKRHRQAEWGASGLGCLTPHVKGRKIAKPSGSNRFRHCHQGPLRMSKESLAERKRRAAKIVELLDKEYPDAVCALTFSNPLELLVATILSAQCTDV